MFLPQVNILKLGIETLKLKFVVGLKTQRVRCFIEELWFRDNKFCQILQR